MPKEQSSPYVMNEEVAYSEKQKNNKENGAGEILQSFHHNVSHLDEMIRQANSIEKNSVKNTDTVNILNTLLQKFELGGSNGGKENKAYFKKHGEHIVLVLNTVVNGERLSSIGDIEKILTKVDELLVKNPLKQDMSTEKKELEPREKIQRANKRLAQYELQIQEMNSSYRENTNDVFMAIDSIVDMVGGESGKKTYEIAIKTIQKNMEKDYKDVFGSLIGKDMSESDRKKLSTYQHRTEELLGKKLENVQSFTGYLLTEKKADSFFNGLHAIKGMAIGAAEALTGTVVFAYYYTTSPEIRDSMHSSVGSFYGYLKKNCTDPDKLWKDFLKALDKEFEKFGELPEREKAEAIGKITGNIMATIIGAKGMSALMKSGKLRLKFNSPDTISVYKKVESASNTKLTPKKWSKPVAEIGNVKTWTDLGSFVKTIDRIRFKEGVTGKVIQEIIDEVRQGTRKVSDVPNYGGLRKTVQKLQDNGGIIPEPTGIKQKAIHSMEQLAKKGMENTKKILPFKEAQKFLSHQVLTGYDHIDIGITKLRTLTNVKVAALGSIALRASHFSEMSELIERTIEGIRAVSFPGKEALILNLEQLTKSLVSVKEKVIVYKDIADGWNSGRKGLLTNKELQTLQFEEGFAVREINTNGATSYEYRGADGKKLLGEYTYASHFKNGQASVTTMEGKNLTIDTAGKVLEDHAASFASIQRFKNGGYRIFEDGHYHIAHPENKKIINTGHKYTLMTEVQSDMVIGVDTKGKKYVINQNQQRFETPFHYVDDFTEHGVAAVQNKANGKWLLIDKEGSLLTKDGGKIRETGEIITKDRVTINEMSKKGGNRKFRKSTAKEARKTAFEEDGFKTNLEAIKAHMEGKRRIKSPEIIRKIEADAIAVLKKNNIDATNPMFSHTQKEGILLFENPGSGTGTRIINLENGTISESFSYVHTPDLDDGFIRVTPIHKKNIGVLGLNGKYIVEPKYTNIQVHDASKKLFEISEMRTLGETLSDGRVIESHYLDPKGSKLVERTGLVNGQGKIVIETGYIEITKTNEVASHGLVRGENHEILHKSKRYNNEKNSPNSGAAKGSSHFDTAFIAIAASEAPTGGKIGGGSLNVFRNETSSVISELKNSPLSLLIDGTQLGGQIPVRLQIFLKKKLPSIKDLGSLESEIGKIVHDETMANIKKYLEKNEFSKLTKAERIEVADYEEDSRKRIVGAIHIQIQNDEITSIRSVNKLEKSQKFMSILVSNLNPELYRAIRGPVERRTTFNELA